MAFSSKQENDYDSQLEQIAGEVDSYILKTDGALKRFREQIKPLAQRWKTYHEAVDKRKKELLNYWEKVKKNPKLQDKNMKPSEELEWDRFYLSNLPIGPDDKIQNPECYMSAKLTSIYLKNLKGYIDRNKEKLKTLLFSSGECKRLQDTIANQEHQYNEIETQYNKLTDEQQENDRFFVGVRWYRYMYSSEEESEKVFGCWRPPLTPLPEYPLNILKPVESGYQRNQTRKELPDARNTREEYERYYIFLSSVHDNFLQGVKKITEGIWSDSLSSDNLSIAVLCCLDKGHGDKTAFLKAALERVRQSKHQPQKNQNFIRQLVIAILVSLLIVWVFEATFRYFKWSWLLNHKNAISLEVGFGLLVGCVVFGVIISQWRKLCFISAVVPLFLMLIPLLGGYNKPTVKQIETPKTETKTIKEAETDITTPSHKIVQQTMNDSPGGTQLVGDIYINETENTLHKPIVIASATVEVRIKSDLDFNGRVANMKAHLAFAKGNKPLLITSSIGYTARQTGNGEVVYQGKLDMDAKDSAVGNPVFYLRDAEYIQIEFGRMPSDSDVLGGDVICIINNSVRLEFSIPPQKLVNNQIFIRNLSESLQVLNKLGN